MSDDLHHAMRNSGHSLSIDSPLSARVIALEAERH
jgi:hypothetical protein